MVVKRSRLSRNIKLVIQKPRGRLKFESFYRLDDYMHSIGAAHILDDIVDMEMRASKQVGQRVNRREMEDRVLMWWNTKTDEPDAISHRPSYIMTFMLRKAAKKRLE
jgi:hypothetical protein